MECGRCGGTGELGPGLRCEACKGTGRVQGAGPDDDIFEVEIEGPDGCPR